ncbi:MAG: LemA family protein [Acidobacteriota bacterium]
MKTWRGRLIAAVGAVVVIVCAVFGYRTHSALVDAEHFLDVAHGRLLLQVQRRHDLLGMSREVVARYASIEERIQAHVIALHGLTKTHGPRAEVVKSEGLVLVDLLTQLDLLIEKYPALKSKGPYVLLMETIQETGFQVTTERLKCNTEAYKYNVMRLLFPHSVVAKVFGFKERPFLMGPLVYAPVHQVS